MSIQTCPACGAPARPGAKFCSNCRAPLGVPAAIRCPTCGASNRVTAKFCANCRTPLQSPSTPPMQPPPPSSASPRLPMRYVYAALAFLLTLCLCLSVSGVFVWELANPTPTRVAVATATLLPPTALPTVTLTPTLTPSPTPLPPPTIVIPTRTPTATPDYPGPVIAFLLSPDGRFGVSTTIGDPKRNDDDNKQLTYARDGRTNNTRLFVDGATPIFGGSEGTLVTSARDEGTTKVTEWLYRQVMVTQRLSIERGASTNRYDTLRIEYIIENRDATPHQVALRMMLDTLIGDNDGVPFAVPGQQGIVARAIDLRGKSVPDFIQVLEKSSLTAPGVVVNLTLSGADAMPPERVLISGWPGPQAEWDYLAQVGGVGAPLQNSGNQSDSAVGLFYAPKTLERGEQYRIVAYYGLGAISSIESRNPSLGLSISSNQVAHGASFWIVARIGNPTAGQRVILSLPPELELLEGQLALPVTPEAAADFTTRSWLVRARAPGANLRIAVKLEPNNITEEKLLTVIALPTPTFTVTSSPTLTSTPTVTQTSTPTPTRSVIQN
jgi:hypothetical protein